MDKPQREAIKHMITLYLTQQGINLYKPFTCRNPLHQDKHPSMRYDPKREKCHCFSCGADYDIFDLIGIQYGLSGPDLFKKAEELYGNTPLVSATAYNHVQTDSVSNPQKPQKAEHISNADFFLAAHLHIDETDYWQKRGLSRKIIDDFKIGYSPAWKHPDAPNSPVSPRLIIPVDDKSYYARDTRTVMSESERRSSKKKVGFSFFNIDAIVSAKKPIFIVEGEFDALSILEVGGEAVSLGGVGNIKRFVEKIADTPPHAPLLILLDNDDRGQVAAVNLSEHLRLHKIPHHHLSLPEHYKDANEMLCADRDGFKAIVNRWEREFSPREREQAKKLTRMSEIDAIGRGVSYVSTGFKSLDRALGGGIYGLTILGGISSVGKTTLATQVSDQIAKQGTPIVLASLEMSVSDLCRKSIAREAAMTFSRYPERVITSEDIRNNTQHLSDNKGVFEQAQRQYQQYAERIYAVNTTPATVITDIEDAIQIVKEHEGSNPVVILDHLQMVDSGKNNASDKQAMDNVIAALHTLAVQSQCPVLAISTLSREAYNKPVQRESFKESGAIEYGADILLGMQFTNVGKKDFDILKESQDSPRYITVNVIKNRLGPVGRSVQFDYYANNDLILEREF